jgi:hypothetical protein
VSGRRHGHSTRTLDALRNSQVRGQFRTELRRGVIDDQIEWLAREEAFDAFVD